MLARRRGSARPGARPGQAVRGRARRPFRPQPQRGRAERRVRHLAAVPAAARAAAGRAGDRWRSATCARAAHAQVGGDWYDVVATPGGGATLVVGDVQGHSLAAAAVMGQLRTALHAYLSEGHHPDVALARANLLMSELDPSVLATCAIFALDPQTGSARIVRAGHPLPVLRRGRRQRLRGGRRREGSRWGCMDQARGRSRPSPSMPGTGCCSTPTA